MCVGGGDVYVCVCVCVCMCVCALAGGGGGGGGVRVCMCVCAPALARTYVDMSGVPGKQVFKSGLFRRCSCWLVA